MLARTRGAGATTWWVCRRNQHHPGCTCSSVPSAAGLLRVLASVFTQADAAWPELPGQSTQWPELCGCVGWGQERGQGGQPSCYSRSDKFGVPKGSFVSLETPAAANHSSSDLFASTSLSSSHFCKFCRAKEHIRKLLFCCRSLHRWLAGKDKLNQALCL